MLYYKLQDNQKGVLNKLRIIYSHRILTWSRNQRRKLALEGIAEIAKRRKLNGRTSLTRVSNANNKIYEIQVQSKGSV